MNEFQEIRKKAGLTQKQVSEILDIPLSTIKSWETGVRTPPLYLKEFYLSKIADKGYIVKSIYEDLDEALEEYVESCIRTGHTDISEAADYFIRENSHIRLDKNEIFAKLQDIFNNY